MRGCILFTVLAVLALSQRLDMVIVSKYRSNIPAYSQLVAAVNQERATSAATGGVTMVVMHGLSIGSGESELSIRS